jgi:hypothetical protein
MGVFGVIPGRTGHSSFFMGGAFVSFSYSLDGKGVITITHGDNWEVTTERLSPDELTARTTEVVRSMASRWSEGGASNLIECGTACEAGLQRALKSGENRLQALEQYRNCIRACYGVGPE